MAQAIINFKTDAKLKKEAKKVLDEMGLNFSIALNDYLKKIIIEKRIEFVAKEIPNARLQKAIKDSEKMVKSGKYKVYKNHEDFEKFLFS
jgi:addiction module RelB/DinJ family antitoxin